MRYSVVDIGSNTVRLHLYNYEDGELRDLMHKKKVPGLASYVEDGVMSKKGVKKLLKILAEYKDLIEILDIEKNYFFATAAIRNTENRDEILKKVKDELDIDIELLSGEDEAAFGYAGVREDYTFDNGIIVDIGGGSTEITILKDRDIIFTTSMPEGSLSLKTKFVKGMLPKKKEIKKMNKYIKERLKEENIPSLPEDMILYGVGGTIRAAGNISQEYFDLDSSKQMSTKIVRALYRSLKSGDREALQTVLQVSPERIHTIIPGLVILNRIIKDLGPDRLRISKKGIREGYLKSKVKAEEAMKGKRVS